MTTLDPAEDRWHPPGAPGAWEWSYFDGLSDDAEWGFVAIWFRGVPMSPYYTAAIDRWSRRGGVPPSPDEYSAFNINLYHRGRRIFFALREGGAPLAAAAEGPGALYGGNRIEARPDGYDLTIDALALGRRLTGRIAIERPAADLPGSTAPFDPAAAGDFWVPASLDGAFSAGLVLSGPFGGSRKIGFTGRAYHDRNFGARPLHHIQGDWQWGRVHSKGRLFVYFSVSSPDDSDRFSRWALLDRGTLVAASDRLAIERLESVPHWTSLRRPLLLEASDRESGMRMRVRPSATLDAGPFYHRNISEVEVHLEGTEPLVGRGITEFLRPSRLGVAGFRPFVKFRVRRDRPPATPMPAPETGSQRL